MKRKLLGILIVTALLSFSVGLFTACNKSHTHNFAETYKFSDTMHWQECSCGEKLNLSGHLGGNASCTERAICEICSARYGGVKAHEYNIPVITDETHAMQCGCGASSTPEQHDNNLGKCECGYSNLGSAHTHNCNTLKFDDYSHWYACSCGVTSDGANHSGSGADCEHKAKCDGCLQEYGDYSHAWNNGELTLAPTQDKDGTITYTCSLCKNSKEETVDKGSKVYTRADLEKAVVEVGWAYYMKGKAVQYDSSIITKVSGIYGGITRYSQEVAPEYGTSDNTIFSVCTGYTHLVYLQGIGHRIFEMKGRPNAITTEYLWYMAENQSEEYYYPDLTNLSSPITANDKDIAIMRWVDYAKYSTIESAELPKAKKFGVFEATSFYDWYEDGDLELRKENDNYVYYLNDQKISYERAKDLCFDYLLEMEGNEFVNMRLGDILVYDGHALLYIGGGYVLDCSGAKYNMSVGYDEVEKSGAVAGRMLTLASTLEKADTDFVLLRPLDFYSLDCDGNPDNDIIAYEGEKIEVTKATLTREKYPAMNIDRTIDKTPYGTIAQGENVTYKVVITNETKEKKYKTWKGNGYDGQDYNGLVVTEKIPEGTTFVSASMGITPSDNILTWVVNIPAGESVEITYTVKVTAPIGSVIVSDGGFVENIPSNVIKNRVGGKKLTEQQKTILSNISTSSASAWATTYGKDMAFAEGIYKALGVELEIPNVQELVENLYKPTLLNNRPAFGCLYPTDETPLVMYIPQKNVDENYQQVKSMLIDGYYGGYRVYYSDLEKLAEVGLENFDYAEEMNKSIMDFDFKFLEVGDILVFATAKNRTETGLTSQLSSFEIAVYAGNETLLMITSSGEGKAYTGANAKAILEESMKNTIDIFFALRPSQADVIK